MTFISKFIDCFQSISSISQLLLVCQDLTRRFFGSVWFSSVLLMKKNCQSSADLTLTSSGVVCRKFLEQQCIVLVVRYPLVEVLDLRIPSKLK